MKFSIIIPAYNAENCIGRAIESVLNQGFSDWELIIVNNGSTDGTRQAIEKYSMRDSRIKLINCSQNSGSPARPRNLGLKEAKGEYIAFLDADDTFFPTKLSKVLNFFKNNPDADLICHGEGHIKNNTVIRRDFYGPYTTYEDLLFRGNSLSTSAIVMKKSCADKVGFFSEGSEFGGFEDYDYWMRLARIGNIKYLRKILGTYMVNDYGESSRIASNCKNALHFLENHYAKWENKSWYYKYLMKKRKALCLKASARELIRIKDFENAILLSKDAIFLNPLGFKQWLILFFAVFGRILKLSMVNSSHD